MKKLLLLAGFLAATASVFAQGMVSFANTSTTLIRTNDLAGHVGAVAASTVLHLELLAAAQGTSISPAEGSLNGWTVIGSGTNSSALAGRFFGGVVTNTLTSAGGPMAVLVRAWITQGASATWDTAANSRGQSTILQLAGSGNPNPPATPAVAIFGAGLLQSFDVVTPVPEPSSIALGLLGLGALALIRRRK